MSDSLLDVLATVPSELLMVYAMTRLLSIRHPKAFWAVQVVLMVTVAALRTLVPPAVRMAYGLTANIVLPVLFSQGALGRRILVAVLSYVVLLVAETVAFAPWALMTGLPIPADDYSVIWSHLPAFVTMHAVHLMVLVMLLGGLELLVGRAFASPAAERAVPLYAVVPLLQVPLLFVALGLKQYLVPQAEELYAGNAALALGCAAVDVALFWSLGRARDKAVAEGRGRVLEEQLAGELAASQTTMELLAGVARERHDFRNQAQVVTGLMGQGAYGTARLHVAALRGRLAEGRADSFRERADL